MLGWAIKKGFQGATGLNDAPDADADTTQFEAPDTPAPIFAARAIRNAFWGQSAPQDPAAPVEKKRPELAARAAPATTATDAESNEFRSPSKPPTSILLTPGTATARRKRVSFGRDVKAGNNVDSSPLAASSANRQRKKTALQQVLENSRSNKPKQIAEKPEETATATESQDDVTEDEWEDDVCNHDMTVDLNEPHSESGKYWKSEFVRYREEAKSDIERLVKYKALAKSFAAKKDAEANGLSQKLKEEQARVEEMEERITNMASQISGKKTRGEEGGSGTLMKDLAKQTSLAVQYRNQVKELESLLKDASGADNTTEASQELKKAKSELKHMDRLRDEVKQLKSELAKSRQEAANLEEDKLTGGVSESSRVQRLEKKLREVKEESRQKDTELRKLRRDYESLKRDAKNRTAEALQVLQDKNDKIAELEKAVEEAKASSSHARNLDAVIAEHKRISGDLRAGIESLNKPYRYEKNKSLRRPKRSASVEDMTLDMTQRSLLGDKNEDTFDITPRKTRAGRRPFFDGTDSLIDIEEELKRDKKRSRRKPEGEMKT